MLALGWNEIVAGMLPKALCDVMTLTADMLQFCATQYTSSSSFYSPLLPM